MHKLLFVSFVTPFLLVGNIALASTAVSGTIPADTTWTLANSPYVVTADVDIPAGVTLTVEAGVVVKFANHVGMSVAGTLYADGTLSAPTIFTSLRDDVAGDTNGDGADSVSAPEDWQHIHFTDGSVGTFAYATIRYGGYFDWGPPTTGILNDGGILTISHSAITDNSSDGFVQHSGSSTISDTHIARQATGIVISGGVTTITITTVDESELGIFAYQSAVPASITISSSTFAGNNYGIVSSIPDIHIYHSRIYDNHYLGLANDAETPIDATNNWWGSASGPEHDTNPTGAGDRVLGDVLVTPWLTGDPTPPVVVPPLPTCTENCNSNVLFLPGLEASRLYRPGIFSEKQIWDPSIIHNNEDLYLNPDGTSVLPNIYTRDAIDESFGVNIYKTFTRFMDEKVRDTGLINEWETVPYDWRLDFPALLANGKKDGENISYLESTTTPYIMQELRHLVATSRTGKVTIIGHSNGGLLAKYILDTLEKSHDPLLDHIDKLILVAVPQIGTPKAVAGMLHGTGLDIPEDIGFLMNRPTARTLAQNMQSGYNLIPSPAYFATVATPLITFTNSPTTQLFRNYYGESITSGSELHDFLLGAEGRTKPTANHVTEPEILNGALLPIAEAHHLALDAWVPPASMQVIQIAGWGVDTVSGINYDAIDPCAASGDPSCPILAPAPSDTLDGDGTVVDPSASWMSTSTLNVERWWVDLEKKNNTKIINRNHADILEVSELNDFIKSVISGGRATDTLAIIANKKPSTSDASRRLRFTLHSPVDMHLYDAFGHHTGVVANPNPLSDIRLYEQNIPNSYYREFGEAKYAGVNTGSSTIVRLTGLALGSFTFDIDEIGGNGTITASTTFVDIPVTASTTGVLSIPGGGLSTTPTSTPMLLLDIDGDGTSDLSLVGNVGGITDEELVAVLRGVVKTLHLPANKEKQLLKKIDKLAKELAKEHKNQKIERRKTRQVFVGLQKTITRYEKKSILTGEEASELQSIVEQIRGSVVK